jgi:hypothetical protein
MSLQEDPDFEVFLVRWDREQDLGVILKAELFVVKFRGQVGLWWSVCETRVDFLGERIDFGVPTEGNG